MDNQYLIVASAMVRRGFMHTAQTLWERWDEYTQREKDFIVRAWA